MLKSSLPASGDAREPTAPSDARRAQLRLILMISLAAGLTIFNVARMVNASLLVDAQVYLGGARLLLEGGDLYGERIESAGLGLPFTYPPFAAILFVPIFAGSLLPGVLILTVAGFAFLFASLLLVIRRFDADRTRTLAIAAVATAVATLLEPVAHTVDFVQINLILLGMVTIDCLGKARFLPRGVLVGLAAAIKLTPAVFILFFLARRDWRAAGWTITGFLGATGLGWLITPTDSFRYWFETLNDAGRVGNLAYVGNQSLRGVFARLISDETLLIAAWAVSAALVVVMGWWLAVRLRRVGQDVLALCAVALTGLLISPVSWSHHWVWVVPLLLVLWCRQPGGRREPALEDRDGLPATDSTLLAPTTPEYRRLVLIQRVSCVVLSVYLVLGMHWWLPGVRERGTEWSGWQQLLAGDYVVGGLVAMGLLVALVLRYGPDAQHSRASAADTDRADVGVRTDAKQASGAEPAKYRAAQAGRTELVSPPPTTTSRGAGLLDSEEPTNP
ncbi:glycosyltransferase 87 family protein [Actinoalloteichus hymeniacidonis]|nr:glycosyltransferase 87 family protein [Actinoalloteichus hymeniacidonis]MBB5910392.1 alpha-1,2-mannosyltransferase [Actinoalloteichus hymeniacidonis]